MSSSTDFATVDLFRDRDLPQDPYAYYDWIRAQGPVWYEPKWDVWLITGLVVGTLCALVAIAPAAAERGARVPLNAQSWILLLAVLAAARPFFSIRRCFSMPVGGF